jgi:pimeloyl-ACP methyl ester carboxylesterase
MDVEHHHEQVGDVRLHWVEAGKGPLVVLLHGFPEFWWSWRHQIPALVKAGFRVVAPDQRGFAQSDKPTGVAAYRVEALAGDVARLVEHLGEARAILVGHDLGGMVAYWTAMLHPGRVARLCIANYPHPAWQGRMAADPAQIRRSWYVGLFQLPLPPRWLAKRFPAVLRRIFTRDPVREGAFGPEDIERYVEVFDAATLGAALNWYRALLRHRPREIFAKLRPIECPTQVIWGRRDSAIGVEWAEPPAKWVWDLELHILDDASHWVQNDRPERFNALLLDFLRPLAPRL